MAITSINEKLAVMEMDFLMEPALPLSPGSLGQNDKQQLLWGYPTNNWGAPSEEAAGGGGLLRRRRRR